MVAPLEDGKVQLQGIGQRAVVVLGMHRSGTSLIARGMKALGVELGQDLMPADPYNPTGFWEDNAIYNVNERLLASIERVWYSIAPIWSEAGGLPDIQALKLEAVQTVRMRFGNFPLWGFKDPRTARLLPFWQDILKHLGVAESYVLVIRNPISVARSLKTRNEFALEKSNLLWLEHYVEAYTHTCGKPRVVVDYDALMDHPAEQLRRIAERLALPLGPEAEQAITDYTDGFVDNDLRHSVFEPTDVCLDIHASELISKTYDLLRKVALDQLDGDGEEVRSALASARSGLEGFGPFFLYSERLEAERNSIRHERDSVSLELNEVRDKSTELTAELAHLREAAVRIEVEYKSKLSERDRQNAELTEVLRQTGSARDEARRATDELQQTIEGFQRPLARLEALRAGIQVLRAATESLKADKESLRLALKGRAQLQADTDAILRSELHNLWNSWSWRLFRPLRNFVRKLQGFGRETEPILYSESQVIQTLNTLRQSLSWELTAPLRLIYRILPHRRRFRPAGVSSMLHKRTQR